jgi:AcrR family transcriptional regulator
MAKVSRNSTDPRAIRTRVMLREALFALLKERAFDTITVRDITACAGLNNATFYLHYDDKWDMLDSIVAEIQTALDGTAPFFPEQPADVDGFIPKLDIRLFEHVQQYWEFYRLMLGRHGVPMVGAALRAQLERITGVVMAEVLVDADALPVPKPLIARFFASAYVGVIEWWLESKSPAAPHEIAAWLWNMQSLVEPLT